MADHLGRILKLELEYFFFPALNNLSAPLNAVQKRRESSVGITAV